MSLGRRLTTALYVVIITLGFAACGGSAKSGPSMHTATTATTSTSTAPVYARKIHATFVGENHAPKVNKSWTYSITVTDANGMKLSGTETTEYLFNGSIVGTEKPENVLFKNGNYHDTIQFPAQSVGIPLVVQAVVHTSMGSASVDWSITVQK
jgi:hypothetical protein